ncbi:DUF3795 domain-containing protein [candidate division KSB1 bacterium]|nr:DUF3795 domain-containing protein [candidate division KSB1 bacterium]
MRDLYSKCGMNCGRCPSFKENLQSMDDRIRCSNGWQLFGINLSPEKLRACDGCQTPDESKPTRYLNCYVRKCAVKNEVKTCAFCSAFPCDDVPKVSVSSNRREQIEKERGNKIPEQDYLAFIEPYEGMKHLTELRKSIAPEQITQMRTITYQPRIVEFPENLSLPSNNLKTLRTIHQLLSSIGTEENISFAREILLKKRRLYCLKLLWAFGLLGKIKDGKASQMKLSRKDYLNQKINSGYSVVIEYLKFLKRYGVNCRIIHLPGYEWKTPNGGLRKEGWHMKMTFEKNLDGDFGLKMLKRYVEQLQKQKHKTAFRYFSAADIRVMSE